MALWVICTPTAICRLIRDWLAPTAEARGKDWRKYVPTAEEIQGLEQSLQAGTSPFTDLEPGAIRTVAQRAGVPLHLRGGEAHIVRNIQATTQIAVDFVRKGQLYSIMAAYQAVREHFDGSDCVSDPSADPVHEAVQYLLKNARWVGKGTEGVEAEGTDG